MLSCVGNTAVDTHLWRSRSLSVYRQTQSCRGHHGHTHMVVGFITTYVISTYHHWCEFKSRSGQGEQHYVIKFVSDLRQVGGFLCVPLVSSTNKTDCHYRTEIVLKVALNTIKQITNKHNLVSNRTYLSFDWVHSHYACVCIRKWQSVTYKNEVTVTLTLTTGSNSWFFLSYNFVYSRTVLS